MAGLAAGTAAVVRAPGAGALPPVAVWGLDPDGGHQGCGCSACAACRAHATNKIFASAADADAGRAHPHCRCAVTQLGSVESYVHDALFVQGGARTSVDRRRQWVQAALASAPPVPPPSGSATPEPSAGTPPAPGAVTTGLHAARTTLGAATTPKLRAVWIRRLAPGRRVLFVQLETDLPIETTIGLLRDRRRLVRRHLPTVSGRQTIRVPLAWGVTRGPALVHIGFRDATGSTHTVTRMVSVPAKKPRRLRGA